MQECSPAQSSGTFNLSGAQSQALDAWKQQPSHSAKPYVTQCTVKQLEVVSYKVCRQCGGRLEATFLVGRNYQCTKCSRACDGNKQASYANVLLEATNADGQKEELPGRAFGSSAKVLMSCHESQQAIGCKFLMKIAVKVEKRGDEIFQDCTISEVCPAAA